MCPLICSTTQGVHSYVHNYLILRHTHFSPGAGKSTTAIEAVRLLDNSGFRSACSINDSPSTEECTPVAVGKRHQCYLALDLDICVPQWMRDNFANGLYPTLSQRVEFMKGACIYVNDEMEAAQLRISTTTQHHKQQLIVIISFSFVNTDLRTEFRNAFPCAQWILLDSDKQLAEERILSREGHFYKNAESNNEDTTSGINKEDSEDNNDMSEWEFQPVDFSHLSLDGCDAVEVNAKRIVDCIQQQMREWV